MPLQSDVPRHRQFRLRQPLAIALVVGLDIAFLAQARDHLPTIRNVLSMQGVLLLCGWVYYQQFPKLVPQFLPDRARRQFLALGVAAIVYGGILGSVAQIEQAIKPPPDPRYVLHLPLYLSMLLWLLMALFGITFPLMVGAIVYWISHTVADDKFDRSPPGLEAVIIGALTGLVVSLCIMFAIGRGGAMHPTQVFLVILLPTLLAATLCYLFSSSESEPPCGTPIAPRS